VSELAQLPTDTGVLYIRASQVAFIEEDHDHGTKCYLTTNTGAQFRVHAPAETLALGLFPGRGLITIKWSSKT
jgi:hypothetical protein